MSDRLTAAQLRLIADQLESGEAEISKSYFKFTPPATTYLEMTLTLVTQELAATGKAPDQLSGQNAQALKDGSKNRGDR